MKSTASSIVSDGDTMEAAAASSEASSNVSSSTKDHLDLASDFPPLLSSMTADQNDPAAPKWVVPVKNDSSASTTTTTSSQITTSSSSSSSSSAVIDASDDSKNQQQIGPPPDVTVGAANIKQCTAGLPDIAAQAPFYMNTANR